MSQRQRADLAAQRRTKERLVKGAIGAGLTVTLGALGMVGANTVRGNGNHSASAIEAAAHNGMPKELIKELRLMQRDSSAVDVNKLLALPYDNYASYKIGRNTVHLAAMGNLPRADYIPVEAYKQTTQYLHDLLGADQTGSVKYFPMKQLELAKQSSFADGKALLDGAMVPAKTDLKPRNKDVYVLQVPETFDIGTVGGSGDTTALAFTRYRNDVAVTFLRDRSIDSAMVEACQAFAGAEVNNPEDFPLEPEKAGLSSVYQEMICNALGDAIAASTTGAPYEIYATTDQQRTDAPFISTQKVGDASDSGYVSEVPYFDEAAYTAIAAGEPIPHLADHFVYPIFG